jgi:TolB-like protein/Flp pilus assembly protein TadD
MSSVQEPHLHLEVGHILFLDIVGYSKLLSDEQKELVQELNQIVRETEQFRAAEAEGKLTRLPTGDGMVLVFTNNPEAPVECALEISKALQSHPKLKVRMGIHSGPVNPFADVNDQSNLAGAGINVAQRVMYCGDAGHILLSKHFAEDLEHYAHWRLHLHDVGEVTGKHGLRVSLVNLYTDQLGNPALPAELRQARTAFRFKSAVVAALLLIITLGVGFWMLRRSQEKSMNAATVIPYKSIAVLPFENRSHDPDNAYFADGIQDEILTLLSKIADLKVISRTSTQHYKSASGNVREIAEQLGVVYLLEGSVQKSGDTVRVNVQLIKAANDSHLWADTFDRKLIDIFSVESEVAKAIADQLQARLTVREQQAIADKPTNNPAAYDAYLRGLALARGPSSTSLFGSLAAAKAFDEAVKLAPDFALAWAELARTNAYLYVSEVDTSPARRDQSAHALEMARQLRSDADEVLLAQAYYEYWVVRDYDGAKAKFTQLRQRLPSNADVPMALALIARRQGLWNESLTQFAEASQLNPLDVFLLNEWAKTATAMRQFSVALKLFDRALSISPNNPTVICRKAIVYQITGDLESAGKLLTGLVDDSTGDLLAAQYWQLLLQRRYADSVKLVQDELVKADASLGIHNTGLRVDLGEAQQHAGDVAGAKGNFLQALTELKSFQESNPDSFLPPYLLSHVFVGLGRNQEAVQQAERAVRLLPSSRDAVTGPCLEANLAIVLAHVGENNRAIAALELLLKVPALWEPPLTPAVLRLDPRFDPLRNDPAFQKLCEEKQQ